MTQQRKAIGKTPSHVFIVADEATANEVRNILELHGYELSPAASEPEDSDAFQQISAAVPETTVVAVQAVEQPDNRTLSTPRPDTPRTRADLKGTYPGIVGENRQVLAMFKDIENFAPLPYSVLILGETGVGKELAAQALHNQSDRRKEKLVVMDCGAIEPNLIGSALFGHEKGAFTDAHQQHIGYFEQADGGTLFLDEIGEIPLQAQPNFLRVIETGCFHRIGGTEDISVNVRVIAATNRELPREVQEKQFRADLYERLKTLTISVPPLRERPGDIPALAQHFLEKESRSHQLPLGELSAAALALLKTYAWPRNIRQLKNAMITAIVNAERGPILPRHLPAELQGQREPQEEVPEEAPKTDKTFVVKFPLKTKLEVALAAFEKACILNTLARYHDNRTHAAAALGIDLRTFNRRLTRHQIPHRNYEGAVENRAYPESLEYS